MNWKQDPSGLWHYDPSVSWKFHIEAAAEDALATKPGGAAWLWFNGTFAPIYPGDTAESLGTRWWHWRAAYQANPQAILSMLEREWG